MSIPNRPSTARPEQLSASRKVDDLSRHQSKHNPDPRQDPKHLPAPRPDVSPEPVPPAGTHPKVGSRSLPNIVL